MVYQSRPQETVDANLIRISILGPAFLSWAAAFFAFNEAFDLEVIYAYLRVTGWGMLGSFMCSFGASTAHHFFPHATTRWLLSHRKYFGLAFAVFIVFHFYGLYLKMDYDPAFFFRDLTIPEFLLGVIAIIFTLAMTFTSSAGMQQKLGAARWASLHTWGGNGILFAFWVTYRDHGMEQLPIFLAINLLIILRCIRRLQDLARQNKKEMWNTAVTAIIILLVCSAGVFVYDQIRSQGGPAVQRDRLYTMRDYFPLSENRRWVYTLSSPGKPPLNRPYSLERDLPVNGQPTYRLQSADGTSMTLGLDSYGIRVYRSTLDGAELAYDPPGVHLPNLYLYEEKTFETLIRIRGTNSDGGRERSHYRLAAIADVRTASRLYSDCMRIEYSRVTTSDQGTSRVIQGQIWLSAGTGRVRELRVTEVRDPDWAVIRRFEEELELVDGP